MHVLVPLLSGKENSLQFIEAISKGSDKITLLQIIDKDFMNKTSTAMGEVMQFSTIRSEIKKKIGLKRKKCEEITEWGSTNKKIISLAIIQEVDKIILVDQQNTFFQELLKDLKKNKIKYETIKIEQG